MFFFGRRPFLSLDVFKVQTPGGREYHLFWWALGTALFLFILGLFLGWMGLLNILLPRLAIGVSPNLATPLLFCLLATSMSCHCDPPQAEKQSFGLIMRLPRRFAPRNDNFRTVSRDDKIVLFWQGVIVQPCARWVRIVLDITRILGYFSYSSKGLELALLALVRIFSFIEEE